LQTISDENLQLKGRLAEVSQQQRAAEGEVAGLQASNELAAALRVAQEKREAESGRGIARGDVAIASVVCVFGRSRGIAFGEGGFRRGRVTDHPERFRHEPVSAKTGIFRAVEGRGGTEGELIEYEDIIAASSRKKVERS
jgi:hypothetical protein